MYKVYRRIIQLKRLIKQQSILVCETGVRGEAISGGISLNTFDDLRQAGVLVYAGNLNNQTSTWVLNPDKAGEHLELLLQNLSLRVKEGHAAAVDKACDGILFDLPEAYQEAYKLERQAAYCTSHGLTQTILYRSAAALAKSGGLSPVIVRRMVKRAYRFSPLPVSIKKELDALW